MYAVFATGGKQYRAAPGDVLKIEKLNAEPGSTVAFEQVLLVSDGDSVKIGAPQVEGAKVEATVRAHGRGTKILVIKFRRRKHHRKQMGHRQHYTEVEITGITG